MRRLRCAMLRALDRDVRMGMTTGLTRRGVLGGGLSALAGIAFADAPLTALRPQLRPAGPAAAPPRPSVADLIAAANLDGTVGFVVADVATGRVIEQNAGAVPLPPASVTKAITALYALEALGPDFRFETRLIGAGPVRDRVLYGDLILAGDGDPVLNTDHLADLAALLRAAGVTAVRGGFRVWGGALPDLREIDPNQLDHLGYNPAISGLNLNFNRVHFEWSRRSGRYDVTMDARTDRLRPDVHIARMRVVERALPVYTYADAQGVDDWTVASAALGESGARWLPVRNPATYAGDVFRTMAAAQGIELMPARQIASLPAGVVLARLQSDPLERLVRDMLLYSTNLTAEALGLTATHRRGGQRANLGVSAAEMNGWAKQSLQAEAAFVDHSGLSDVSRISAAQMVRALVAPGSVAGLRPLLKTIPLVDSEGEPLPNPQAVVVAKTGTLNFVSALAGYLRSGSGADLAFAIFTVDPERRARALSSADEVPEGARSWNARSRRLQQVLLQRWGAGDF